MTSVDAVETGSASSTFSDVQKSDCLDIIAGSSSSSGPCTATVSHPCRPVPPLLQSATLMDCSDVISEEPRDLTLSAAEPTAAADLAALTVATERSVTCSVEGPTLSLLGGLLPLQQQQQQQQPSSSSSLCLLSTPHVTLSMPSSGTLMDVLDDPEVGRDASVSSPRHGVVVAGLPRSKPATCLVDDCRFFSPLIVHRAVACPYPIPLGVVGAHPGCFIEPQRCWWPVSYTHLTLPTILRV